MYNQDQTIIHDTGKAPKKKQTAIILISLSAVLIACLCILIIAAVVYFDPFNLGLIGRLRGGYDSIATTIPADTDIYISIDMLKFLSEDTRGVFDAFAQNSGDPDVTNREEFIQQMDDTLFSEAGVTFSEDIQPWIGQYMGLSFFDVSKDEYGEPVFDHWFFVVEARSKNDADTFIAKFVANISAESGQAFAEREHKGAVIQELVTEFDYDRIAISRKGSLVFVSSSAENIIRAIDTQSGETLAKNEQFKAVTAQLPTTRLMTAFISQSFFEMSTTMIEEDILDSFSLPANLHNLGMALSLVNEGIKVDFSAIYDLDSLSQAQIESLSTPGATGKIAEEIPSGAIGFVTGKDLGKVWDYIRGVIQESSGADPGEFNKSMQLLEEEIGINPDRDLFPLLDQEWGIAILRERNTILAEQIDIPLGLLAIAETSSPDQLNQKVQNMTEKMSGLGLMMVDEKVSEKMTYYELQTFLFGEPILAFGVKETQLFLSTSPIHLETNLDPSGSLANDNAYQVSWQPLPNNMNPILFLNIQQLLTMIPDLNADDLGVLRPIQTIALAGSPLEGNIKQWVLMVYVEAQ